MIKFILFLWKLLWASFLWFLGVIISAIIIAFIDPLSGFFIIIPELSSEISPFFFVHTAALAQVCIYYVFFHSYGSTTSFFRKYGLFIWLAYITSFILYFIHRWASLNFVLFYGLNCIIIIDILYFLWKEIYPKIQESDFYKFSENEWNKYPLIAFIWSSTLRFDLLWFWKSSRPIKPRLSQFLEILLYTIPVSFVLFLPILLLETDWYLFDLIAWKIQLNINWSLISLSDGLLWMSGQMQLWISWRDEYREIYKWKNIAYTLITIFLFAFAGVWAFIFGFLLKNRKRRLLSLIFLLWVAILLGIFAWIYVIYTEVQSYKSNKQCIEYNRCGKGPNWEYGSQYHPTSE